MLLNCELTLGIANIGQVSNLFRYSTQPASRLIKFHSERPVSPQTMYTLAKYRQAQFRARNVTINNLVRIFTSKYMSGSIKSVHQSSCSHLTPLGSPILSEYHEEQKFMLNSFNLILVVLWNLVLMLICLTLELCSSVSKITRLFKKTRPQYLLNHLFNSYYIHSFGIDSAVIKICVMLITVK